MEIAAGIKGARRRRCHSEDEYGVRLEREERRVERNAKRTSSAFHLRSSSFSLPPSL